MMRIKSQLVNSIVETEKYDIADILSLQSKVYSYVNPVSYLDALKHKELYGAMDGLFVDGSLMALAVHLCYGKKITRRSPDMVGYFPQLFEYANKNKKTICVVGSTQEQMEAAVEKFSNWYPDVIWKNNRNGFFADESEMRNYARLIAQDNIDFLISGLGSKMQEKFLIMCKEAGYKGIGFSCGGFIRQIAENSKGTYYPYWINRLNLRFLYRMCKEPHTRKRYLIAGFVFPVRFVWERLFG